MIKQIILNHQINIRFLKIIILLVFFSFFPVASASELSIGDVTGLAGRYISIPINYVHTDSVTAVLIDIQYDQSILTPGSSSTGPSAVNHRVINRDISPGVYRIILYSSANAILDTGNVVNTRFAIQQTLLSDTSITLSLIAISNPSAVSLTNTTTSPGVLTILEATLDIDQNGKAEALTDGVLISRYIKGSRGNNLVRNAIASNCQRCSNDNIEMYLKAALDSGLFDIDNNSVNDINIDTKIINRHLFKFSKNKITEGIVGGARCARCGINDIIDYLDSLTP